MYLFAGLQSLGKLTIDTLVEIMHVYHNLAKQMNKQIAHSSSYVYIMSN